MSQYYKTIEDLFQSRQLRLLIFTIMSIAFIFGYMDQIIDYNFQRLHIFLFNLTTGGFTILYFTENKKTPSPRVIIFLIFSIVFALFAFFEFYALSMATAIFLGIIAESIRQKHFSIFPWDFFRSEVHISKKFQQASLLCLVLALFISSIVILNNKFFFWFHFPPLKLNVFFLGFSFPVSLITLSIIFNYVKSERSRSNILIEHWSFWSINLGVIIFFVFIIFEILPAEFAAAFTLFVSVIIVFFFFFRYGIDIQQKKFLISGIFFLLGTAITGLLYIVLKITGDYTQENGKLVLQIHTYLSLYGWNLSGLMILLRWNHFPIRINTRTAILFHWIVISAFAPLGQFSLWFAAVATLSYIAFMLIFFTGRTDYSFPKAD